MSRIGLVIVSCAVMAVAVGCARETGTPAPDNAAASVPTAPAELPSPSAAEPAVVYTITEGSAVSFVGTRVSGRNAGGFHAFQGEVAVVDGQPERSSVRAVIDTTSLWADHPDLTRHLASDDFLAVVSYPWASFTSTRVERTGEGSFRIAGNLDLHGQVREIAFPATIAVAPDEVRAEADFTLDRTDFGIDFPGPADNLIEPLVRIRLKVVAVPKG